ncbi:MAG: phosphoribosylformylglycinamidine synthase subunit PurS [Thermoplasmatota archaeon]
MYRAEVRISLKKGVADPEGQNTRKALELLGFKEVGEVRTEKLFAISLEAADEADARRRVEEMCRRLLVNPVIHNFEIRVAGG